MTGTYGDWKWRAYFVCAVLLFVGCQESQPGRDSRPIKNWDTVDEEIPLTFALSMSAEELADKFPDISTKLLPLKDKKFNKRQFLAELSAALSKGEMDRYQDALLARCGLWLDGSWQRLAEAKAWDSLPRATPIDGGWRWSRSFDQRIRDVYVASEQATSRPYVFGTDYRGIISGKNDDVVTVSFLREGVYPIKIVFADSDKKEEMFLVAVGSHFVSVPKAPSP